jgi:hypothetical protein|tara:strand:+ start:9602 stop:10039 length:438 start_codon:yes stop_codon:yes gene_type:complete
VSDTGETAVDPDSAPPVLKFTPALESVSLLHDHNSVVDSPIVILSSLLLTLADDGGLLTVTVAESLADPALFEHVMVYDFVLPGLTDTDPAVAPFTGPKLVLVQLSALVLPHVRVEDPPVVMEDGIAESVAVGAGVHIGVVKVPE